VVRQKELLPSRERILLAARTLFQRRGYFAVGTAEILTVARAPKGSMYHHFPGGKEEIAIAVVQAISKDVLALLERLEEKHVCVADMVRDIARRTVYWLKASKWLESTMLSSTAMGAVPDLAQLHAAVQNAFDLWRTRFTRLLVAEGWSRHKARKVAETVIAASEGAMILARIEQNERVVRSVAEMMAILIEKQSWTGTQIVIR
jgi:TetR/AcrR family transcriptional regulator, lmrAB and yxaGH operons repressor